MHILLRRPSLPEPTRLRRRRSSSLSMFLRRTHPTPVHHPAPTPPPNPHRAKRARSRAHSTPQVHFTPETLARERQKSRKNLLGDYFSGIGSPASNGGSASSASSTSSERSSRVTALFAHGGGWERDRDPHELHHHHQHNHQRRGSHHHHHHHRHRHQEPEPWPQSAYYLGTREDRPLFLRRRGSRVVAEPEDMGWWGGRGDGWEGREVRVEGTRLRRVKSFFRIG